MLWVRNGALESVSLTFGILSYLSLDKCTSLKPRWSLVFAALFFLIALLIYQPTGMIVFGFMFLKLFFQEGGILGAFASTADRGNLFLWGCRLFYALVFNQTFYYSLWPANLGAGWNFVFHVPNGFEGQECCHWRNSSYY